MKRVTAPDASRRRSCRVEANTVESSKRRGTPCAAGDEDERGEKGKESESRTGTLRTWRGRAQRSSSEERAGHERMGREA